MYNRNHYITEFGTVWCAYILNTVIKIPGACAIVVEDATEYQRPL